MIGSPTRREGVELLLWPQGDAVRDVVIYGAGRTGSAIARVLLAQGMAVRMVEMGPQARRAAEALPRARAFRRPASTRLRRAGAHRAGAGGDLSDAASDAKNEYGASIARVRGVQFTVALAHEAVSWSRTFDKAGNDVAINPRAVTAEEIVRFAHDRGRSRSR